jgi:hypothetical protein
MLLDPEDLSPFGEKLGLDDDNKKPRKDSNITAVASTSIPQDQTGLYKRY